MIDIDKQVAHWRQGADEDWAVADELIRHNRIRHGLFFAHLALEKILKGLVCKQTVDLAPPIHNLVRLAQLANLNLSEEQIDLLAETNEFNIDGRYPEMQLPVLTETEAIHYLQKIRELMQCLNSQF